MSGLKFNLVVQELWIPKGPEGKKIMDQIRSARKSGEFWGKTVGAVSGTPVVNPLWDPISGAVVGKNVGKRALSRAVGGKLISDFTGTPISKDIVRKDIRRGISEPFRQLKGVAKSGGKLISSPEYRKEFAKKASKAIKSLPSGTVQYGKDVTTEVPKAAKFFAKTGGKVAGSGYKTASRLLGRAYMDPKSL